MKTLKESCVVRDSVYDGSRRDTVLDLTDLIEGNVDADDLFKTNSVTDGMHTLLEQGFLRFVGRSPQSMIARLHDFARLEHVYGAWR